MRTHLQLLAPRCQLPLSASQSAMKFSQAFVAAALPFLVAPHAVDTNAASSYPRSGDKLGAVASESAVCSDIGIDLLKKGGNAADALVGTVLCVGVIGMYHSG